ncbi:MAG: phosphate ABC transporter ATP-binding protein [Gemmatimonadetes bacterium]|nr:phosphate ABC transporter ATP-binding protein [Gemmatimonadota bacterium]
MITSLIGPSGCGKSTLLRTCNRIIERLGYVRTDGSVRILGHDVFAPGVELVQVRKQVGMVFQRPNPLPISIRDNVLFGFRIHEAGTRSVSRAEEDEVVESALRQVLLWDKVKDRLNHTATVLSLEEQQKLCIARLLPVKPAVLLMDEPCSALDPEATAAVEELIWELRGRYNIVIVTHNMAQARRASEECVFMLLGKVIEHGITEEMFLNPVDPQTTDYIEGRYG